MFALSTCAIVVTSPVHHADRVPRERKAEEGHLDVAAAIGYERLYQQLNSLAPDSTRVATATGVVLRRDLGSIRLTHGTLTLLTPVDGRTVAAVFVGFGLFRLEVPTDVERAELHRALEVDSVALQFKKLFLLFTDSTLAELEDTLRFTPGEVPRDAKEVVEEALDRLRDEDSETFDTHLAEALLNGAEGHFHAHIYEKKNDFLIFRVDPFAVEEIALYHRARGRGRGDGLDIVCSFHWTTDRDDEGATTTGESKERVTIGRYAIESTIERNLHYSASATLEITAVAPEVRWVPLSLFHHLEVDSARWDDGTAALVFRGDEAYDLWLGMEPPLVASDTRSVTLYYHGWLMEPRGHMEFGSWFPRHDGRVAAIFDLTYHTPPELRLASVGDLVDSVEVDDIVTTHWVTPEPIEHPGFGLVREGRDYWLELDGVPDFTVVMKPESNGHGAARDVGSSLAFYTEVFGPLKFTQLYATEIPQAHGQAFSGLIHLSRYSFFFERSSRNVGWDEEFRAHEVAHQWWGIGVVPRTYRDAWLSEGFAEFSSWWYVERWLDKPDVYRGLLEDAREDIFDRQERLGPIDIGFRCVHEGARDGYGLIVYQKGAWVLHMLRTLLRDPVSGREDRFRAIMRDFYATYEGRRASTADFQRVAEKYAGMGLEWFFRQWVEGTALPTYLFSTRTEENEEGRYLVRLRVEQQGVPDDFRMQVPVLLDFGDDREAIAPLVVSGPVTETTLPLLTSKPRRIVFNPNEAVLARVVRVRW